MADQKLSLIADSGIQIQTFDIEINPNADLIKGIGFLENIDLERQRVKLGYAIYLPDAEVWVSKQQLLEDGYYDAEGKLPTDINPSLLTILDDENDYYRINDIESALELYADEWLPIPYFEYSGNNNYHFGSLNWCRMLIVPKKTKSRLKSYQVVLAFDTKTSEDYSNNECVVVDADSGSVQYRLCNDLDLLLNYCDAQHNCEWVDDYLHSLFLKKEKEPEGFPRLKYLAFYIYMLRYLQASGEFPDIQVFPNKREDAIDVDMVIDIGNSRTCGLLFEIGSNRSFEFTEVKKLEIQDFSRPGTRYDEPFDMRLAFHKADFGEIGYKSSMFKWPSFIRVGKEAKRLIYQAANVTNPNGKEAITNHSSPKRYLWDDDEVDFQWQLIRTKEQDVSGAIFLEGITQQFSSDGTLAKSSSLFGVSSTFSRKSLMTFVFLEIIAQAMVQINSFSFRNKHGEASRPRKLRTLVITCPTAMIQAEQLALRQCAQDAAIALKRFYSGDYESEYDPKLDKDRIKIIPSPKDLKKDLTEIDTKKDWIYDEATCCQLVFLYAEISKRYLNKCEQYFDLYGKHRADLPDYNKKSVTIGSIDIGAGTTDLMISAYQYDDFGKSSLTPTPLYWESFSHAGDALLKQIIQQVILEGRIDNEKYRGCTGVIENEAIKRQVSDLESRLNNFVGENSNNQDAHAKAMRRKFNTQISVPIAERYLAHAHSGAQDTIVGFDDLFPEFKPSAGLLDYFEETFGFRFEEIKWKLSTSRIFDIVETVFEPMIKQICTLLYVKGCDFVLLAGRPSSLTKIYDLFLKFYPVSPDRIICLNDYRVGRWYPFQDGNGYFTDKKSIVAVGAAIALMGGKLDNLRGFRLNMETIKRKLTSTAEYIGIYEPELSRINEVLLEPDLNKQVIEVSGFPLQLGFRALPAKSYPGRLIYLLDFDDEKIRERKINQLGATGDESLSQEVEDYKTSIKNRHPFKIKLVREYRRSREHVIIDSIEDKNRDPLPKSIFNLKVKTMDEDRGYWLDTGEFLLKVKVK